MGHPFSQNQKFFSIPVWLGSCHASEGWHPDQIIGWMPAFAGMTRVKF